MAIDKHANGWKVTVDIGRDPITKARRRVSQLVEGTKQDARDVEAAIRLEHSGKTPGTKARTVGEVLEQWYAQIEPDRSPTTLRGYRQHLDDYLLPAFGKLPIRKLSPDLIDTLYRRIRKEGARNQIKDGKVVGKRPLSPATVRRVHATLSSALAQAESWGWIPSNPCARTSKGGRQERHEIEPPTPDEIFKVLAAMLDVYVDAYQLAAATGARRGELCGVQWADIDFDNGAVTFRRSIGDVNGKTVVIEKRRKSAIRTVSVDNQTLEMLKRRRTKQVEAALACGIQLGYSGYVLSEEPGQVEPIRPQRISQRWRDAAGRVDVKARLHDLRHWHFTELLASGVSIANVRERAGWSSDAMLRTYTHAVAKVDRQAADIIGQRLAR